MPEAREVISSQLVKDQISIASAVTKSMNATGMTDGYGRTQQNFFRNSAEQLRQTYGLMLQKMTTDLYRGQNSRTFGLVRAPTAEVLISFCHLQRLLQP